MGGMANLNPAATLARAKKAEKDSEIDVKAEGRKRIDRQQRAMSSKGRAESARFERPKNTIRKRTVKK